jgi:ferredoxin-NADP reductase
MSDLSLVVTASTELCPDIREVRFAAPDGALLPSFTPGSHLAIEWAPGKRNSYSLTGDGFSPRSYCISVRREENGAGGSRWVHQLRVGDTVSITQPRSAFPPVATATHHVLIAGGIGVTPILSHARAASLWGRSFEVIYSHRPGIDAHEAELRQLCGGQLTVISSAAELAEALAPILAGSPLGTHLYSCGPAPMLDAIDALAAEAYWPSGRVHRELFTPIAGLTDGPSFEVKLKRSGTTVTVPKDVSMLTALLDAGVDVVHLCRQGVCGECRLPVCSGQIEHRDSYLTDDERASGECMLPCVSRAAEAVEVSL